MYFTKDENVKPHQAESGATFVSCGPVRSPSGLPGLTCPRQLAEA